MIDKLTSIFARIFFTLSLIILFVAIWDKFIGLFGWELTWVAYQPGRLLELSAIMIIFVIALLSRQIREEIKKISAK